MRTGLKHGLAAVVTCAPHIGVLIAIRRILGCFGGMTGDKYAFHMFIIGRLSVALEPVAIGVAIAIVGKLILGEPESPPPHSGWGIDPSAKTLLAALAPHPPTRPTLSRGALDSLPVLVHCAVACAVFFWLLSPGPRMTLLALSFLVIARFTHLGYRRFDAWHDELESQMDLPAPARDA